MNKTTVRHQYVLGTLQHAVLVGYVSYWVKVGMWFTEIPQV